MHPPGPSRSHPTGSAPARRRHPLGRPNLSSSACTGVKCGPGPQAWSAIYPFAGPQVRSPHFTPGREPTVFKNLDKLLIELQCITFSRNRHIWIFWSGSWCENHLTCWKVIRTSKTWKPSWVCSSAMPNRPRGASYDDDLSWGSVELNADASGDHVATVLRQQTVLADLINFNRRIIDTTNCHKLNFHK